MFRVFSDHVACDTADEVKLLRNGHAAKPVKRTGAKKSWQVARDTARRLKRTDVAQVRREIAAGDLPKAKAHAR